jgi:hypothetical protein
MAKLKKVTQRALRLAFQKRLTQAFPEAELLFEGEPPIIPTPGAPPVWPVSQEWPIKLLTVPVTPWADNEPELMLLQAVAPFLVNRSRQVVRWGGMPRTTGDKLRVALQIQVPPLAVPELSMADFAARYCERQESTPERLQETLQAQAAKFRPYGWMLLECVDFSASRLGSYTILPFGPENSYRAIPDHPVSPRGLASDMSVVAAVHLNLISHVVRSPQGGEENQHRSQ